MRAKLDGITQTCTTAQQTAYKLARDEQYNIFSFGANWAFYELEQAAGVTFGLTLYNTEAVKLLLKENPAWCPTSASRAKATAPMTPGYSTAMSCRASCRAKASTTLPCRP